MLAIYKNNEYKKLAGGAQRYWHGTRAAYEANKDEIPPNTMICITDDNDAGTEIAPIGAIFPYYGTVAPKGYLFCHGDKFDIDKYEDLFVFLGTDTLPDLRDVIINENTTYIIRAQLSSDYNDNVAVGEALRARFNYTTNGAKVVGKWIDGRPIWQKVCTCASTVTLRPQEWAPIPGCSTAADTEIDFDRLSRIISIDFVLNITTPSNRETWVYNNNTLQYSSLNGDLIIESGDSVIIKYVNMVTERDGELGTFALGNMTL